mmetsp:Transcript_15411/g.28040  ORF Transcript_15411/g.28040 Transcript_15411/m.28040 type:complete len:110 (+) Transcript_15411:1030-1359(+)
MCHCGGTKVKKKRKLEAMVMETVVDNPSKMRTTFLVLSRGVILPGMNIPSAIPTVTVCNPKIGVMIFELIDMASGSSWFPSLFAACLFEVAQSQTGSVLWVDRYRFVPL